MASAPTPAETTIHTLDVVPEICTEVPANLEPSDIIHRAASACRTMDFLAEQEFGEAAPELITGDPDSQAAKRTAKEFVREIDKDYAEDPTVASSTVTMSKFDRFSNLELRAVNELLQTYGQRLAVDAEQLREFVRNKLILETDNPDGRIRLQALNLLGKMSDVGLYIERKEVTVRSGDPAETERKLKAKLLEMKKGTNGVYKAESTE